MKISLKSISCLIILAVFSYIPETSTATSKPDIDVVVVMDSSGSMKKTDPLSLRIPAAKLFISLLSQNDRAGIISFSDEASPLSPLLLLDSDSNKKMLLQATEKITSSGLHTNLFEALNKGLEVLSGAKKSGREQIVVLMSDGMMDTGDPEKDRALLEKLKQDLTKALLDKGIKVYAIAFTEGSDRALLEKVSKQTGGFYHLALTDKDFHIVFTSIFESLKRPDMLPMTDSGFLVDNSIEEVTIIATKEAANTTIQLDSPDGKKYSSRNKPPETEWVVSNNFDMMTIRKPVEGKWKILFSTGNSNKAYVITNLNLQTNFNELYPLFGQTLDIKVWLERESNPIKENEVLEKINISLELIKPDGETTQLQPFPKGDGTFERKIELYTAGNYKLRILADGKTFQREKAFTFKVADTKESLQDFKAKQALKEKEKSSEDRPAEQGHEDSVSWIKVTSQFLIINLLLGIIVFAYLKRDRIKNFINSKLKKEKKP